MRLRNCRIVLGVTGSIAAYKALELLRRLKREGADLWVVMTKNATEFVAPLSFSTLAGHPVALESFEPSPDPLRHINLAEEADLLAIAPATANTIGKIASGIGNDLLSTLTISTKKPVVIAPAMHNNMWENLIVKGNVERLKGLGYQFVEPEYGELAGGSIGKGRMAPVEKIVDTICSILKRGQTWAGRLVVVTAGRTEEPLDPVRVITNRSSGRMGIALVKALKDRGAAVQLIMGKVSIEQPPGVSIERVSTSKEMLEAVERAMPKAKVLIMAAAVSDYRPVSPAKGKAKSEGLTVVLERTEDILTHISKNREDKVLVGFSLETEQVIERAKGKFESKNLDLIIANSVESLESDMSQATLIFRDGRVKELPRLSKRELAELILDEVEQMIAHNGG